MTLLKRPVKCALFVAAACLVLGPGTFADRPNRKAPASAAGVIPDMRIPSAHHECDSVCAMPSVKRLRFISYNLLFPRGLGYGSRRTRRRNRARAVRRMDALVRVIARANPDIIALQEAGSLFLRRFRAHPRLRRYRAFPGKSLKRTSSRGGVITLSRLPVKSAAHTWFPDGSRRAFMLTRLRLRNRDVCVANVHLSSLLRENSRRVRQLDLVLKRLRACDDAVVIGDFNFGEKDLPETRRLAQAERYRDLWRMLRPGQNGFTWDRRGNRGARKNSYPGETSRRLDRILVRSHHWRPRFVRLTGVRPYRRGVHPSDHYAVVGEVEWRFPPFQQEPPLFSRGLGMRRVSAALDMTPQYAKQVPGIEGFADEVIHARREGSFAELGESRRRQP